MALPWVRLDSNIASHDKITALLMAEPRHGWRAAFVYVCSLGHCGGHGTDGLVAFSSLPFIHADKRSAELLVQHGLWEPDPLGWRLPNWSRRQETAVTSAKKRLAQSMGALKANCVRWHGAGCGCWNDGPVPPQRKAV